MGQGRIGYRNPGISDIEMRFHHLPVHDCRQLSVIIGRGRTTYQISDIGYLITVIGILDMGPLISDSISDIGSFFYSHLSKVVENLLPQALRPLQLVEGVE